MDRNEIDLSHLPPVSAESAKVWVRYADGREEVIRIGSEAVSIPAGTTIIGYQPPELSVDITPTAPSHKPGAGKEG